MYFWYLFPESFVFTNVLFSIWDINREPVTFEKKNATLYTSELQKRVLHVFLAFIPDSLVLSICASGSWTSTGGLLYLKNIDYPRRMRDLQTNCTCSVETTSCTSNINVYFIHFELDDDGSCTDTQKIIINDNGAERTFTCSDNTYYSITKKLTSSGNYLTVSLENTDGVGAGYLFTGYEGMFIG